MTHPKNKKTALKHRRLQILRPLDWTLAGLDLPFLVVLTTLARAAPAWRAAEIFRVWTLRERKLVEDPATVDEILAEF